MFRRTWTAVAIAVALIVGVAMAAPAFAGQSGPGPVPSHSHTHPGPSPTRTNPGYPATVPTFTRTWATPARANGAARIFVAVFSGAGVPTGTVTITVAGQSATVPLQGGAASWGVTGLTPGAHRVAVTYNPTPGSPWKSSSASTVVRVLAIRTRTTVVAHSTRVGNPATLTARVTALGAGEPAGAVTFAVAGRSLTATLSNGTATVQVRGLRAGTYVVTAAFTPSDPAFTGSSGSTFLRVRGFQLSGWGWGWGWNPWAWAVSWHPSAWGSIWFT